jgi:hypothetical protein
MRKLIQLESSEYLIPLGRKTAQLASISNSYQSQIRKVPSNGIKKIELFIHARINKGTFDSLKVVSYFRQAVRPLAGVVSEIKVYSIDNNWNESLIGTFVPTQVGNRFELDLPQSLFLPAIELSGAESYAIEAVGYRRNKTFTQKSYFNDLWIF